MSREQKPRYYDYAEELQQYEQELGSSNPGEKAIKKYFHSNRIKFPLYMLDQANSEIIYSIIKSNNMNRKQKLDTINNLLDNLLDKIMENKNYDEHYDVYVENDDEEPYYDNDNEEDMWWQDERQYQPGEKAYDGMYGYETGYSHDLRSYGRSGRGRRN